MQKNYTNFMVKLTNMLLDRDVINLAVGQPDFKPPAQLLAALKENIEKSTGYMPIEGLEELRTLIRKKLLKENKVKTKNVIITTGAIEAIFDSMLACLQKNSEVILFSPYYGKYTAAPYIIGANIKTISLKNNRPNLNELEQKITKNTKMIVINTPSNPSGIVYSKDEIKHIIEIIEKYDLILLSDEVYEKYVYDGNKHVSPGEFSDKVITVNSFSKTYGFPGLRLGYLAGIDEIINPILDIHMSNTTCSPYMHQKAATVALSGDYKFFNITSFDKRRRIVMKKLDEFGINYIYPAGTFYVYIYIDKDCMKIVNNLIEQKILVMPGKFFGDTCNSIRISYTIDDKLLEKGLKLFTKTIVEKT